jgi:hypothetical protein
LSLDTIVLLAEAVLNLQQEIAELKKKAAEPRVIYVGGGGADLSGFVKKSGDTMTGALTLPELDVATADSSLTIEEYDEATLLGVKLPRISAIDSGSSKQALVDLSVLVFLDSGPSNYPTLLFCSNDFLTVGSIYFDPILDGLGFGATNLFFATDLVPTTDNLFNLGSATAEWKNLYVTNVAYIDTLSLDATAGLGCATDFNPTVDDSKALGSGTREWKTLYIDGIAYIDSLQVHVGLNLDSIDVDATSVATVGGVIPVTVEGVTRYIPFYETYA